MSSQGNKFIQIENYLSDRYQLRYNEISNDLEAKNRDIDDDEFSILNENNIAVELYKEGFAGFDTMLQAYYKSDLVEKFNPVFDYFENLKEYDNQDHIGKFCSYIQTTNDAYFRYHFEKMLVRVIACAYKKIAFNKHCFVLYGKQNDGKSYLIRTLCPKKLVKDHYTEDIDFNSKDGKISLATNLFINLDELAKLGKEENDTVKNFISQDSIKLRRPFERKDTYAPRIASFFGSTNNARFLTDETGSVRWLIFEILGINHNDGNEGGYSDCDIDALWSQAFYFFKQGNTGQLTKEDIAKVELNNKKYQKATPEIELISQYFEPVEIEDVYTLTLTATQLIRVLHDKTGGTIKTNTINIGKALRFLNFKQKKHRDKNSTIPIDVWLMKETD